MDPKAMPSNLSKRKQIVMGIIKPFSEQNETSMEQAAVTLDQERVDMQQTVTQYWANWKRIKNTKKIA